MILNHLMMMKIGANLIFGQSPDHLIIFADVSYDL